MTERWRAWQSIRGPEPELVWMVVVSVVIHGAAAGVLFTIPRTLLASAPPPVVAYTVKIVDPSALGGRLPKGALTAEKKPSAATDAVPQAKAEPKPEPAPEKAPPAPEPKAAEKVVTIPEKKPAPKPAPEAKKPAAKPAPAKPSAEEVARQERDRRIQEAIRKVGERGREKESAGLGGTEEGKGAALGVGGDGGGGGILTGLDFIIYKNQVEGIIKKNWTWVGANPNLTVRVGFRIRDSGEIGDLRIIQPSGDGSYDQSVMRAIRASSPLPPPPEKYRDVFGDYLLDFLSGELQS